MLQEDGSGEDEKADFQEAKQKAGRNRKLLNKCRARPRAMTSRLEKAGAGAESARLNYHHST